MSVRKLWVPDNSGIGVELTAESGSDALKPEGAIRRSDGGPEVDSSNLEIGFTKAVYAASLCMWSKSI